MKRLLLLAAMLLALLLSACDDTSSGDMPGLAYIKCVQHQTDAGATGEQARVACQDWR
jgi:hypothetical protein